jgi:putative FmdB family regulatory protein
MFDFHCSGCGHDFEALVRGGDTPLCPACQSAALETCLSRISLADKAKLLRGKKGI